MNPIIVVCGTTAVGKSNLAIEIASRLRCGGFKAGWVGARIINADSMQVYSGLHITTNKIPMEERKGVEHLLMGIKEPGEQYNVGDWVKDALEAIMETHERKEIPIVVGGTSYWIQHLIFPNRLVQAQEEPVKSEMRSSPVWSEELLASIASLPDELRTLLHHLPEIPPSAKLHPELSFELHTLLSMLDPLMAGRWHWKDTRKVLRSLEIIKEYGRRGSDIVVEQSTSTPTSMPRFDTLNFWLYAKPAALKTRIDARVDKMLEEGLLDEIRDLRNIAQSSASAGKDYTSGIYQSIGYREFSEYLSLSSPSDKAFQSAVERMKLSTAQYAKRQIKWIRNKLLPQIAAANAVKMRVPTFLLDATDLDHSWTTNVKDPALCILEAFLDGGDLPDPKSLSEHAQIMLTIADKDVAPWTSLNARQKIICNFCTVDPERPVMIEEGEEWTTHSRTARHKKMSKVKNATSAHEGSYQENRAEPF